MAYYSDSDADAGQKRTPTTFPGEYSGMAATAVGWLVLIGGVISGIVVLNTFSSISVPSLNPFSSTSVTVANPLGPVLGYGIIAQSAITAIMCFALGSAAENTAFLRREAVEARRSRDRKP